MKELYKRWLENATDDSDLSTELRRIKSDDEKIKDRFYQTLAFGTAGLRGKIGAGTNRMNVYVVRQATQGLANHILKNEKSRSVAISYDSRNKSVLFANESARVLAANGIKVHLVKELQPTPVLSFLVRYFNCASGIMVTASHNRASDNGYKVYGSDGCQMTDESANSVYNEIQKIDTFTGYKIIDLDEAVKNNKIEYVEENVYDAYLSEVKKQQINSGILEKSELKIAYTALNGTGSKLVFKILKEVGAKNVDVVKEQEAPDGNFTTCKYPNPETREALKLGLKLAAEKDSDILLATDPDADRVGVAVKYGKRYRQLSGNEVGILLTHYILSQRKANGTLPKNGVVVRTIVSSVLADRICQDYGIAVESVLTGFKYIGEVIRNLEKESRVSDYLFGFEESCGYLSGSYVRDKDAVFACMLIAEMAALYKSTGTSVSEVLDSLYEKYGYYENKTLTFSFPGAEGSRQMNSLMNKFRKTPPKAAAGYDVIKIYDFLKGEKFDLSTGKTEKLRLPSANVLSFILSEKNAIIVRPSGTEPKIKLYITAVGEKLREANAITFRLVEDMVAFFGRNHD